MGNVWLKIKVWTKGIVTTLLVLYAVLFIYNNSGKPVPFWYWFGHAPETSILVHVVVAFFAGVVATLLVRTTLRTVRQIRELREKSRLARIEREHADMKAKAAMLQSKTSAPADSSIPLEPPKPTEQRRE